jgi:poly(3-hydroxybutyrate) depolymerase
MIYYSFQRFLPGSLLLLLLLPASPDAGAQSLERVSIRFASLASLCPPQQAEALARTLPVDQNVQWRIYAPDKTGEPAGILAFISPTPSGMPQEGWIEVLERKNLIWVAADGFGNEVPTAERVLAAIMGLTEVQRTFKTDSKRVYAAGVSGGGRAASTLITRFPRLLTGAVYMVGVDFWSPEEKSLLEHIKRNRYVFLTGHDDFNRRETKAIYRKYQSAGVEQVLLMDLPDFGHEYPNADQLAEAINYLDTGVAD